MQIEARQECLVNAASTCCSRVLEHTTGAQLIAEHASLTPRGNTDQVADFHRTLLLGGVAMNPRSHLRLVYEANPLAFLAEQAGGKARSSPSCP